MFLSTNPEAIRIIQGDISLGKVKQIQYFVGTHLIETKSLGEFLVLPVPKPRGGMFATLEILFESDQKAVFVIPTEEYLRLVRDDILLNHGFLEKQDQERKAQEDKLKEEGFTFDNIRKILKDRFALEPSDWFIQAIISGTIKKTDVKCYTMSKRAIDSILVAAEQKSIYPLTYEEPC